MPELPEVETVRRQLAPRLTGRVVLDADSHPSAKFTPATECIGAELTDVARRGKFLLIATDDDREIIVHLGMTGALLFPDDGEEDDAYVRAHWRLDGPAPTRLVFRDVRRFGRIRVVDRGDYRDVPTLAAMGPEPFDPELDAARFTELLARSRRPIKTRLLSQRPIAGVGNIYADEALWLAGIDPRAPVVGRRRAERLLDALRRVLTQGIDNGGTTLRDYRNAEGGQGANQNALEAYGRAGLPCGRCGRPLRSAVIDARTTTWCGTCQRR